MRMSIFSLLQNEVLTYYNKGNQNVVYLSITYVCFGIMNSCWLSWVSNVPLGIKLMCVWGCYTPRERRVPSCCCTVSFRMCIGNELACEDTDALHIFLYAALRQEDEICRFGGEKFTRN